ncbi:MAG: hypothetical protein JSV86_11010 [Gemmatimonadota bacterium]|nr:MAG: hypothetical protein JSV86_11010 [Gemmatimonadota bacterium]
MANFFATFPPMWRSVPALAALALMSTALHGCGDRDPDRTAVIDLLPEQIGGWTRSASATYYDRETIFDYINGAGEVYRSYAFNQVVVAVYAGSQGPDITVELFDMGGPADAYGVFSHAREREEAGIGGGYEQRGRVLCFWQDRYYVCVASEERTADSDRALLDVARAISQRLPPASDPPDLVAMLPGDGLVASSQRFFHLHQSLNYHYYLARENILELSSETDAVLARYAPGSTYLLLVRYASDSDAAGALTSFKRGYLPDAGESRTVETENGMFVSYGSRDRFVVVVLDAVSETAANDLLQATLNGLRQPPN